MSTLWPVLFVLFAAFADAQTAAIQAPGSGILFDPLARAVRPILGIPGAAVLGPPLLTEVNRASVSPNGAFVLTATDDGIHLMTAGGASVDIDLSDDIAHTTPDLIGWAGDSSAVAIYYSSDRTIRALPTTGSTKSGRFDLSSFEGQIATLGIAPGAQTVAFGVTGSGVYTLSRTAEAPALLVAMTNPATTLFSLDGALWILDGSTAKILRASRTGTIENIYDGLTLTPDMTGFAVSDNSRFAYILHSSNNAVLIYDIVNGSLVDDLKLPGASATSIEGISAGTYLLRPRQTQDEPAIVLRNALVPSIVFIPVGDRE